MALESKIKTIIPVGNTQYFAAYMPNEEEDIKQRIEPIVCWSLLEFERKDSPDEVVGQIVDGDVITEATSVDEDEGFGEFLGYFRSTSEATDAIMRAMANREEEEGEEGEEDYEEEEEEGEDGGGDEEEDEEEDEDEDEDGDEEDDD